MKGAVPLKLYIYAFTRRREESPLGNLLIFSKRPTDLYISLLTWLTKPSEGASGHPVRMPFCRYNRWIKNPLCVENRVSIHLAVTWSTWYARWQHIWFFYIYYMDNRRIIIENYLISFIYIYIHILNIFKIIRCLWKWLTIYPCS